MPIIGDLQEQGNACAREKAPEPYLYLPGGRAVSLGWIGVSGPEGSLDEILSG